jgi:catechol 2,3-dioxygenase-like lactoylglutathione lyase family enzyme
MPLPVKLDHFTDWERSNAFYTGVLGAELIARPVGFAYRFGDRRLNVHGPGVATAEVARLPVAPGNSDLCFEWNGPIADAIRHLERCGVAIEAGPMQLSPEARKLHVSGSRTCPTPPRQGGGLLIGCIPTRMILTNWSLT